MICDRYNHHHIRLGGIFNFYKPSLRETTHSKVIFKKTSFLCINLLPKHIVTVSQAELPYRNCLITPLF